MNSRLLLYLSFCLGLLFCCIYPCGVNTHTLCGSQFWAIFIDMHPTTTTPTPESPCCNTAGVIVDAVQVRPHCTADHAPPHWVCMFMCLVVCAFCVTVIIAKCGSGLLYCTKTTTNRSWNLKVHSCNQNKRRVENYCGSIHLYWLVISNNWAISTS